MSNELMDLMKTFDITCTRCLDTKILWRQRENVFFARMDGHGDYDILNCDKCCDGLFNKFVHNKDIVINDIHIFNVADGECHCIEELKKKAEIIRMQNEPILLDIINDGTTLQWRYNEVAEFNKEIKNIELDIEVAEIVKKVNEAILAANCDVAVLPNLIEDVNSTFESNHTDKTMCKQIKDKDDNNTYIIFVSSDQIERVGFGCFEWCGFNSKNHKFSLKYTVCKPLNDAAQLECDKHMPKKEGSD